MRASGKKPDHHVFPSVLKSCALLSDLKLGESIHGCIIRLGMDFDLYTCNALMNMYGKFQKVFAAMDSFSNKFRIESAHDQNVNLNQTSYIFPKTNANSTILDQCYRKRNCSYMVEVDRRGSIMDSVKKVFEKMLKRDVVSWNTVIAGNAENGKYEEALMLVREMGNDNLKPDSFTLSSVLPIFAEYVDLHKGKEIHGYAMRHGFDNDVFIGSSLVGMYAKCARVEDALQVFNILPQRDSISWNSIIAGCVQNGLFDEGLRFFHQMLKAKVKPVPVSFSSIMPACANLIALHLGKQLHGFIIRVGYDDNMFVSSSLVDMYAKCGYIKVARWIFDRMDVHDMVSWTAIIMGYALHGQACHAVSLFEQMEMEGVRPNYVAFVAVLTACSHAGMMNEAWRYFNSMTQNYGIVPGLEHYACMADLLGRAGKLDEAFELISSMHRPVEGIWLSLLSACRVHKNVDLAEKVAEKIFEVDPENTGAYILLSNTYAAGQRWKDVAKLQYLMRNKGIKKSPAFSWIEVKNKAPAFVSGDKSHL
jgi:pentatricopeptide repeat protein